MTITVRLLDETRCAAVHAPSGAELVTDVTPEYGGGGTSFSSTDLVGVALATCIGSSLAPILSREGIDLGAVGISVEKALLTTPKRIGGLRVVVELPPEVGDRLRRKLVNAARTCAVHRSLGGGVEVDVQLAAPGGATDH